MRRPSPRCTPNPVTIQRASFPRDAAGGRTQTPASTDGPYRCSIQPESADSAVDGHRRATETRTHRAIFHDDVGLKIQDQILYGSRVLTVVGVLPSAAGQGRTWVYSCREVL